MTVVCRWCHKEYDLMDVEVTARYADCSVFKTPCCGKQADDRRHKSLPDFYPVVVGGDHLRLHGWV